MENKNSKESSTVDIEEEDETKIKHLINALHRTLSRKKGGQNEEKVKEGTKADEDGEMAQKAATDIEVEDLRKEKRKDQTKLGSMISFERELSIRKRAKRLEKWSSKEWDDLRAERLRLTKAQMQTKSDKESLRAERLKLTNSQKQMKTDNESLLQREMALRKSQKQTKTDNASLLQRELKVTKSQKQTKADNESLFQREMKLWQDKKDLRKERKSFDEAMAVGRRELQNGKEETGVSQQEVRREKRFSRINSYFCPFLVQQISEKSLSPNVFGTKQDSRQKRSLDKVDLS